MHIGGTPRGPGTAGAGRGAARAIAAVTLTAALSGAGTLVTTTDAARAAVVATTPGRQTGTPARQTGTPGRQTGTPTPQVGTPAPQTVAPAPRVGTPAQRSTTTTAPRTTVTSAHATPTAPPATTTTSPPATPTGPPATPTAPATAGAPLAGVGTTAPADAGSVDCRRVKCVALTFDDGPGPYTKTLLRTLAAYGARATFFVVGQNVTAYPGIVRRAHAAGHEIGNHSWSHPDLSRLPAKSIRSQLARTDRAVEAATGVRPALVRPPYGAFDASVRRQAKRPLVLWSVDTLDWRYRNSARVARKAIKSVRPGSVILFHDIHPTTVRAIPKVLRTLSKRGYRFVTVSQLFGGRPPRLVHSRG
ncbi:polysaccharide deacetylase family protein [Nonomuraea sp. FMUSA5-5]|uniref:Polysaccharide deacetylase family protein n=1 Tax=Nonomuraea composti TaxID=2720023 RepID=A0ABX1BI60_9ACTN|nr:polysaccharide deacetylase family protein [Nonomuraea sp. FMUSA5-5]NJP97419.1 polysaccharide deacetylase family protein [Nonomuraea sp. FMUSA5-5]